MVAITNASAHEKEPSAFRLLETIKFERPFGSLETRTQLENN